MVSILQINNTGVSKTSFNHYNRNNKEFVSNHTNVKDSNNLLMNFLQLMGRNNALKISFGDKIEHPEIGNTYLENRVYTPQGCPTWLEIQNRQAIQAEATKRITGDCQWPKIDKVNAWMVTAETKKFMQTGGLGTVANDLPDIFNKEFSGNNHLMSVVTPLYTDSKHRKIIETNDGLKYQFKSGQTIPINYVTTLTVPMYEVDNANMAGNELYGGVTEDKKVNIYTAMVGDDEDKPKTPYIFIEENKVFNTDSPKGDCYADNDFKFGENVRFAFFSKCVYELAKHLKNQENEGIESEQGLKAPNVMVLNDWHAAPIAPLMKYMSVAEAEKKNISEETARYFKEVPSIYIAHNLTYQGKMGNDKGIIRTNVLGTLFGEHAKTIVENSYNINSLPIEDKNALFKYNELNPGMMALSLSDRIVPVSSNYGEELLSSCLLGQGMQNILKIRNSIGTFTPITNGLTKSTVVPDSDNIAAWMKSMKSDLTAGRSGKIILDDIELQPYGIDNVKEAKVENKAQMLELLKRIIKSEQEQSTAQKSSLVDVSAGRRYVMYKPNETKLDDITDISKVPVMTFIGRVAGQKGMDTIFQKSYLNLAREFSTNPRYKGCEVPIVIIGGPTEEVATYKNLEKFKDELRKIDSRFADRFILFKGFANTNLLSMGSDFFLIPSTFEPCGLVQMEVMPKGVLPIATATGGLVTTITDQKDGFLSTAFYDGIDEEYRNSGKVMYVGTESRDIPELNWRGYEEAMNRALYTFYKQPNKLLKMQKNAMEKDFSWNAPNGPIEKYMKLIKEGKFEDNKVTYFDMPDDEAPIE